MSIQTKHILNLKKEKKKITMLTAYDVMTARLVDSLGVELILVGDSLGNMVAGFDNTIPVTMEQMIYHTQAVTRGAKNALVVGDMPFLSYQISEEDARRNAGRLIKEGGAKAVKMEVGQAQLPHVKSIIEMGIPVMAHIGFTPQSVNQLGGYRVQGRSSKDAKMLLELAKELEAVGCFAILLEMVPAKLSEKVSKKLSIPTIGIGAGSGTDGQVLVTEDVVGLTENKPPSFVKKYANLNQEMKKALTQFVHEVRDSEFPDKSHQFE